MAAPLNTCTTIQQRGVVRFLWAKNMDAAKDMHKEMLPFGQHFFMHISLFAWVFAFRSFYKILIFLLCIVVNFKLSCV
jgi:hypothetical protein